MSSISSITELNRTKFGRDHFDFVGQKNKMSCTAIVSYLQSWTPISPFLLNNKIFTDTDSERTLVAASNHHFYNCQFH